MRRSRSRSEQAFIFRSKLHVASIESVWRFDFAKSDTNLAIHHPRVHGPKLKTSKCWHQVAGKSCGWLRMSRQRPHIDRTWRTRESPPTNTQHGHDRKYQTQIPHQMLKPVVLGSRYQHDSKCVPWRRTYHHINLWMFSVNQIESQIYDDLCVWTQRSWNP